MRRIRFAIGALLLAGCAAQTTPPPRHSTRDGTEVRIAGGPLLHIPQTWVRWHERHPPSLHHDARAIARLGKVGDFDRELAELCAALFDADDCAFQGSDDGFGEDSATYFNLTARVYLVEGTNEAALARRFADRGARALHVILSPEREAERNHVSVEDLRTRGFKERQLEECVPETIEHENGWLQQRFRFHLNYGDYGAKTEVDVWLQAHGPYTLAVAFLHTRARDHATTKRDLLTSIRWPRATPAPKPNFVVILADDLGYGDLSCYDGWIETPHVVAARRLAGLEAHRADRPRSDAVRPAHGPGRTQRRGGGASRPGGRDGGRARGLA